MATLIGVALLTWAVLDTARRVVFARGRCGVLLARLGGRRAAAGAAECRLVSLLLAGRIGRAGYRRAMAGLAHRSCRPNECIPVLRRVLGTRRRTT
ncbi:hypothetical protein [Streptomyces sp. NPDC001410]|uniref:hypothetical protein n=1 Tax=Streptomyces sp. NPDC001410 TaxID=3364574 RepID=UPI003680B4D1